MPTLTINNQEIEVENGTSILQAAKQLGIEIPHFCYHDRLSVPANCRMCLVEIEGGPPKPAASCAMACGDGMVVKTDSDMVKKARKGVMEMLLINHPLDCPICDQGGECDLQDQAMGYGFDRSRYSENKRAVKDKELGPLIKTVMTRCINCTRCVRFADEIAGTPVLGQLYRGEDAEIGTFVDQLVKTELSGNLIDICPVGALTSKPYAFKARPWELRKTESIDVHDAVGSNIRVDARGREVLRILPRLHEDVNEEWINDRTRFAYDGLNKARLDRPYIRNDKGKLQDATWDDAFALITEKLSGLKGEQIAGIVGDMVAVEETVALKDLLTNLGSATFECRTNGAVYNTDERGAYLFNSTIAGIEDADGIIIVGANPRYEASLINARIRKTVMDKRIPAAVIGEPVDLTYKYTHAGTTIADFEKTAKEFKSKVKAKNPIIIVGEGAFAREDGEALQAAIFKAAKTLGATVSMMHSAAGRVGALDVGFTGEKSFADIMTGTKDGSIQALYLLGADEFNAAAEIGWQCFTIYQGHHGDHGASRADVVLPAAAYTEKDGIYVNTEGRPQMARRAVSPPGDAREDWTILRALSEKLGARIKYDTATQLRERIAAEFPHVVDFDAIASADVPTFKTKSKPSKDPITAKSSYFYLNNAICRASDTMQACHVEFVNGTEQLEAAE